MESENRLGGVLAAQIISVADVASLTISGGYVSSAVLATGKAWQPLELAMLRSTVTTEVEESDAGQLLKTEAVLYLCELAAAVKSIVTEAATKGCLLRIFYSNGDVILYGTMEWPMHGSLVRVPGTGASDGHVFRLTLVSEEPYQGLK